MIGFFRKKSFLLIFLGTVIGALVGLYLNRGLFSVVLSIGMGMVVGYYVSIYLANKQVDQWNKILFQQGDPEKFIEIFMPVLEKTPKESLEYVDGHNKIAYAWEAQGEFDKALECLAGLRPEKLRGSAMDGLITTYSNRVRIQLLREDIPGAETALEAMREATELAMLKNKRLGNAGRHYVRLYENWLLVLKEEISDDDFIAEEIKLSGNRIRNSELQLVLAKSYADQGEQVLAQEMLLDAMTTGTGLWTERRARELLQVETTESKGSV